MSYIVYAHINKTNGKIYIGITCRKPKRRWGSNGNGYKQHPYFYNAIQKYSWENFEHEIIASNLTKQEAENFEKLLISKIPKEESYNVTAGGEGTVGYRHTEDAKQRISEAHKGKIVSDETRKKLSEAGMGKIISEEAKKKMSKARKGNKFSEETKKNMSEAGKGRIFSEKHKRKLSEVKKGIRNLKNSKTVNQYDLACNFIKEWSCMSEAERILNISRGKISETCKGKRKTAGGFKWKYK
jgi:group I intron endonuclease